MDESLGGRRLTTDDVDENVTEEGIIVDDDDVTELELYLPIKVLSFWEIVWQFLARCCIDFTM